MAKVGRKPWVPDEETYTLVEKYAGRFLKEEQISYLIGINPTTFTEKKKQFPELVERIKKGRAKVAEELTNKLYETAILDKNITMLIFLSKAVLGLRENDPQLAENVTVHVHTSKATEKIQLRDS